MRPVPIGLGVVDATEDPELRAERQKDGNYKYAKSFLALALPAAYCLLDAAGTFADNRVLEILTDRLHERRYVRHAGGMLRSGGSLRQLRL